MILNYIKIILILLTARLLVSCASSPKFTSDKPSSSKSTHVEQPKTRYSKSSEPEKENATTFYNLPGALESVSGRASYYADDFDGRKTANGETFNMYELTAAHRTYPFNTMVKVTNLANNKSTIVRINDRGPVTESRIIDLSLGAAMQLDMVESGVQNVQLDVIEWGE